MLLQTLFDTQACEFVRLRETEDTALGTIFDLGCKMIEAHKKYEQLLKNCKDGKLHIESYHLNLLRRKVQKFKGITVYYDDDVSGINISIRPNPDRR